MPTPPLGPDPRRRPGRSRVRRPCRRRSRRGGHRPADPPRHASPTRRRRRRALRRPGPTHRHGRGGDRRPRGRTGRPGRLRPVDGGLPRGPLLPLRAGAHAPRHPARRVLGLVAQCRSLRAAPTAGACAVGAREVLIAYNVWIRASPESDPPGPADVVSVARSLAATLRRPGLRTLGAVDGGAQRAATSSTRDRSACSITPFFPRLSRMGANAAARLPLLLQPLPRTQARATNT